MQGSLILAIDQGTTNTKALLVDHRGVVVFKASTPLEIFQPKPGYVEQDPLALWQSVVEVSQKCVRHASLLQRPIAGIAISNQRETSLVWRCAGAGHQAAGEPLSNAITWQCRRSAPVCERLAGEAERIQATTGLPLDPLVSASKWTFVLDEQQELRNALAGLLEDIEDHVTRLPDDAKLEELVKSARKFVQDVRDSGAAEAMGEAESALGEFSGSRGHDSARKAADILEKFLAQCQGQGGMMGQGQTALRFSVRYVLRRCSCPVALD